MDLKNIKELIKILEESSLESIVYKDKAIEVELKKQGNTVLDDFEMHSVRLPESKPQIQNEGDLVKSPLVGVFYAKPASDVSDYTQVGNHVNQGDVLCIIEAMKVMNEIKAPRSGIIQAIHIQDGEAVDFNQALFTIA